MSVRIHCGDSCITLYTVSRQIIRDVNSISKLQFCVCVAERGGAGQGDEFMNLLLLITS